MQGQRHYDPEPDVYTSYESKDLTLNHTKWNGS